VRTKEHILASTIMIMSTSRSTNRYAKTFAA
jgi:hypothetical protein